jgi:hypothetical protein
MKAVFDNNELAIKWEIFQISQVTTYPEDICGYLTIIEKIELTLKVLVVELAGCGIGCTLAACDGGCDDGGGPVVVMKMAVVVAVVVIIAAAWR